MKVITAETPLPYVYDPNHARASYTLNNGKNWMNHGEFCERMAKAILGFCKKNFLMHFSLAKIRALLLHEKRAPGGRGGRARHFGTKWQQVRFYKRFVHFRTVNRKSLGIERRATLTTEVAHLERRRNEMLFASGIVLFGGACS